MVGAQNAQPPKDQELEVFQGAIYEVSLKTKDCDHKCLVKQTTSASPVEVDEELSSKRYQYQILTLPWHASPSVTNNKA